MASSSVVKVKLVSSAETGHFYTTMVNKKNMNMKEKKKLQFKKYDPVVRKHVVYNEEKMK